MTSAPSKRRHALDSGRSASPRRDNGGHEYWLRKARAADQPIPHARRQCEIEPAGPGAGTQIERRSERPGRQAVANGQPMQPAREQFIGLWTRDDRPMTRQEVVGYGVELRLRATRDPSTSSQQSLALRRAAPARKRDMRERLDRRRCDPLGAIPHGLGRRPRDDPDDLADQPFGQGEDRARDRLVRKARSPGQRQGRFKTVEKGKIVFAMTQRGTGASAKRLAISSVRLMWS